MLLAPIRSFLLTFFLLVSVPLVSAQTDLECPDSDLTSYLLALIDGLFSNGLTTFESLLVKISESDQGYNTLSNLYLSSDKQYTFLTPTDSAFQMAGIGPPFQLQSEDYLNRLFGLHILEGTWGKDEIKDEGSVVDTLIYQGGSSNGSVMGGRMVGLKQKVVLRKGDDAGITIKSAFGDVHSWAEPLDLTWSPLLDTIRVLPIDHVMEFPPNISAALRLSTTTRSEKGLTMLESAIQTVSDSGADELMKITQGGWTFFAPVDDAWDEDALEQVQTKDLAAKLIGNHYTNNQTIFSPSWSGSNNQSLTVMTGEQLKLMFKDQVGYVSLGNQTAQILRADIVLENGVMHIIDKVLLVPPERIDQQPVTTSTVSSSGQPTETASSTVSSTPTSGAILNRPAPSMITILAVLSSLLALMIAIV